MKLFDTYIKQIEALLPESGKVFAYEKSHLKPAGTNNVLLLRDTAYELGGSQKPCLSSLLVTDTFSYDNTVELYGRDLFELEEDSPFVKLVFLQVADMDEDKTYDKIKALEQIRYSYCPEGFMTRASAISMREQIRVSKKVVKEKLSFGDYGNALIEQYLLNPAVKGVRIIFMTQLHEFDSLSMLADKVKTTTSAMNKMLDNLVFDCASCNLKEICDEVEGMKELHRRRVH